MKNRITKFACLTLGLALSLSVALTATVHADGNPIWSGLWAGSNFDLNFGGTTPPAPSPTPGSTPVPTSSPAPGARKVYVALGDSVAAGYGLPAAANATAGSLRCSRSPQAYPYSVARNMDMRLKHVACTGATFGDLITKQGVEGPNIPAQLDRAFAGGTPDLISITAGANDAHWSDFISACYQFDCSTRAYTAAANAWLVVLQGKMHAALTDIYLRSGGRPPRVVVTGYYNPVSPACASLQTNVTAAEITWLSAESAALSTTIQNVAANYSFVTYAPVDFNGHDLCSGSSWLQGVSDAAPFHPTATGQRAYSRAVLAALGR